MAQPANKSWTDGHGVYVWPPTGERFVSVTAYLSVIHKQPLLGWAARTAAEFAVTRQYEWRDLEEKEAIELIKEAPFRSNEAKSGLGTRVHAAVEAWTLGKPAPTLDADVVPYMLQFQRFVQEHRPKFDAAEVTVYSRVHGYAGTLDMLVWIGNELYLVDVKTGKWAYPEAALQLSAYAHGEFAGVDNRYEVKMPRVDKIAVLLLRPRSFHLIVPKCAPYDEDLFEGFLAARDLWRWKNRMGELIFARQTYERTS